MQTRSLAAITIAACVVFVGSPTLGQGLHAIDRNRNYYSIDRASAARSLRDVMPSLLGTPGGLAFHVPSKSIFVASRSADGLYLVDDFFGGVYFVGPFAASPIDIRDIEWNSGTESLFAVGDANLYTVSITSGAATLVASTAISDVSSLAYDSTNDAMYMVSAGTDSLYALELATGAATLIGPLNGPTNPSGLAYVPEDDALYLVCSDTDALYSVDRATGAATMIGSTGPGELVGLVWVFDPDAPPYQPCPYCLSDYDSNGGVDGADLAAFFHDFEAGAPCADVNQDGGVTGTDLADFFHFFEGGCC
jgi:DNA-binding beta-propeller fold protein YncE